MRNAPGLRHFMQLGLKRNNMLSFYKGTRCTKPFFLEMAHLLFAQCILQPFLKAFRLRKQVRKQFLNQSKIIIFFITTGGFCEFQHIDDMKALMPINFPFTLFTCHLLRNH